jgi:hypothetical protein
MNSFCCLPVVDAIEFECKFPSPQRLMRGDVKLVISMCMRKLEQAGYFDHVLLMHYNSCLLKIQTDAAINTVIASTVQ